MHEIERMIGSSSKGGIAYTGTPRKHPYDQGKFLLFSKEGQGATEIYEFRLDDVLALERLPTTVDEMGAGVAMLRFYIREGAHGIRLEPFTVSSAPYESTSSALAERILETIRAMG